VCAREAVCLGRDNDGERSFSSTIGVYDLSTVPDNQVTSTGEIGLICGIPMNTDNIRVRTPPLGFNSNRRRMY
jgi:hypothetical protein